MNKRGDTPTILLFVIALTLVVTALSVFASFKGDYLKEYEDRNSLLTTVSFYQNYFTKQIEIVGKETVKNGGRKEEFQKLMKQKDLGIVEFRSFFDRIDKGEFDFRNEEKEYLFEMKDYVIFSEKGANSYKRNLDLKVRIEAKIR